MTTPSESARNSQPPQVGTSSWRSEVLQQAERLEDELKAIPADALATAPPELAKQAERHIAEARQIAELTRHDPFEVLRSWWTGNSVNAAWNHLQSAREDLLAIAPSEAVRALLPSLARRAASVSPDPAHDPNLEAVKEVATNTGAITDEQRLRLRAAQTQIRVAQDEAHEEARSFRNNLWLLTARPHRRIACARGDRR